uniref:Uncharacterized protein n=1 Tax=Fagus sylvatica TaxID=28930 RepID=A0A2N9EM93_FAGSY
MPRKLALSSTAKGWEDLIHIDKVFVQRNATKNNQPNKSQPTHSSSRDRHGSTSRPLGSARQGLASGVEFVLHGVASGVEFVLRGVASGVGLSLVVAGLTGGGGYRSEKRATPWVSPWWWLASLTGGGGGKLSEKRNPSRRFQPQTNPSPFRASAENEESREKREERAEKREHRV